MTEKAKSSNGQKELIKVEHLKKYFPVRGGLLKRVVAWVPFIMLPPPVATEKEAVYTIVEAVIRDASIYGVAAI